MCLKRFFLICGVLFFASGTVLAQGHGRRERVHDREQFRERVERQQERRERREELRQERQERRERMSPEERRQLRQDIDQAGREIYRNPPRHRD